MRLWEWEQRKNAGSPKYTVRNFGAFTTLGRRERLGLASDSLELVVVETAHPRR